MARILVRDDVNRLYWCEDERWVAEIAEAWEFKTLDEAGIKALGERVRTASVVLAYENPVCELALNPDFCVERTIRRDAPP